MAEVSENASEAFSEDAWKKFLTKASLDKIDERKLSDMPAPPEEPEFDEGSVNLAGIVPEKATPKLQETAKCLSSTYSWEEDDGNLKKWCFVYKNKSSFDMTVKMDFTDSTHLEFQSHESCEHRIEGDQVWAEVPPFQERIVLIITADNRVGWSLTSSVNMKFSSSKKPANNEHLEKEISARLESFKALGNPQGTSILHFLHKKQTYFIDTVFPPLNISMYDNSGPKAPASYLTNAVWRRVRDFVDGTPVIVNTIHPNDVDQGELGDCWILSSITALAEHPHRVEKLLVTQRVNQVGLFQVQLCVRGLWQTITLDEYIPCYPRGGPKFTKCKERELWVSFIEKAFAKTYGSYERCIEGDASNGMTTLTGCPVKTIRFKDKNEEEIWAQLMESAATEDDLLTVSTSLPKSKLTSTGLISKHSYTILNAQQAENGGVRLLQIRNPWGSGEWTGSWSDKSDLWTDEMKDFFRPSLDDDDGTFWMSLPDVLKYFSRMNICYCESQTTVRRLPATIGVVDSQFTYSRVEVTVPSNGKIYWIGLHQTDTRIKDSPPYTDLTCLIFKKEDNEYVPHLAFVNYKNFAFEEVNLGPGQYELTVFTSGRNLDSYPSRDITITIHKNCECMVEYFSETDVDNLINKLVSYSKTGDMAEYLDGRLRMYYVHKSIHVWSVVNTCDDYEMEISAKLGLNNMHTCFFTDPGNDAYSITIPIKSQRLVTAAVITDYKKNSGLTRNMDMTGKPVDG